MQRAIVARIQAHPSRRSLAESLAATLPFPTEISEHSSDPPSPYAGYVQALRELPPHCSHVLVLQDDAQPCPGFADVLPQVAKDVPVCLFLGDLPRRTAQLARRALRENRRYVTHSFYEFVPCVAILWPRALAESFSEFARTSSIPATPNPRADDHVIGYWRRKTRTDFLVTCPSLVEHPGIVESVKGRSNGATRMRALALAEDARLYDW